LSKLEVIQYVIDYICDLQSALETHPAVSTFDAAAALGQKKIARSDQPATTPGTQGESQHHSFTLRSARPSEWHGKAALNYSLALFCVLEN
jgi:hypothetical protein